MTKCLKPPYFNLGKSPKDHFYRPKRSSDHWKKRTCGLGNFTSFNSTSLIHVCDDATYYCTSTMIWRGRSRDNIRSLIRVALLFNMYGALARATIFNFRAINKSMPRKERLKREREKERQTEAAKYWKLGHFLGKYHDIYKFTYCLSVCLLTHFISAHGQPILASEVSNER